MTDYSTLDDNALRRMIAERLGWTELNEEPDWSYCEDGNVYLIGINNNGKSDRVPNWPNDVDAALTLIPDILSIDNLDLNIFYGGQPPPITWAQISIERFVGGDRYVDRYEGSAPILARAICLAFLGYADSKERR